MDLKIEELIEYVTCDLCGNGDEEFLYFKKGILTGYPFRVVRCRSCGLIYLTPRLNSLATEKLYNEDYYKGKGVDPSARYCDDFQKECDEEKVSSKPEETLKNIGEVGYPPPANILDFGCGLGDFIKLAIKQGYAAEGFEVSKFAAEFAMSNGLKVYSSIEELPIEHYDVVTAIEVLEHVASPLKVLNCIYRCLKPNGLFYYTTRNFYNFYKKWKKGIEDELDSYITPEGHIYLFSPSVMNSYFKKIGFSKVFTFDSSKRYWQKGCAFRLLLKFHMINGKSDVPLTLLEKFVYYWGNKIAYAIGRKDKLLPLAIK